MVGFDSFKSNLNCIFDGTLKCENKSIEFSFLIQNEDMMFKDYLSSIRSITNSYIDDKGLVPNHGLVKIIENVIADSTNGHGPSAKIAETAAVGLLRLQPKIQVDDDNYI